LNSERDEQTLISKEKKNRAKFSFEWKWRFCL